MRLCRSLIGWCSKQRRNIHISASNASKASKIPRLNFLCQRPFWFNILTTPLAISNTQLVFITTIFANHFPYNPLLWSELNNCFVHQDTKLSWEIDRDLISCIAHARRTNGIMALARAKIIPKLNSIICSLLL